MYYEDKSLKKVVTENEIFDLPNAVYCKMKIELFPNERYLILDNKTLYENGDFGPICSYPPQTFYLDSNKIKNGSCYYSIGNKHLDYQNGRLCWGNDIHYFGYVARDNSNYLVYDFVDTNVKITFGIKSTKSSFPATWCSMQIDGKTAYVDPNKRVFYLEGGYPCYLRIQPNGSVSWYKIDGDGTVVAGSECEISFTWESYVKSAAGYPNRSLSAAKIGNTRLPPLFTYIVNGNDHSVAPDKRWKMRCEWFNRYGKNGTKLDSRADDWFKAADGLYLVHSRNTNISSGSTFWTDEYGHIFVDNNNTLLYFRERDTDNVLAGNSIIHYYRINTMFRFEYKATKDHAATNAIRADYHIYPLQDKAAILGEYDSLGNGGRYWNAAFTVYTYGLWSITNV